MKILITGFDPFGGENVNPAHEAVKLLPDTIAGAEIIKLEVPTRFHRAGAVLEDAMQRHKPDAVICVGQAGGRAAITPEKVAINLMDGRIPDNAGYQPVDVPIREDGETAYFTSLPVKAMVQKMRAAGIPAALSYTAGSFVCNCLMYTLLYLIDRQYPAMPGYRPRSPTRRAPMCATICCIPCCISSIKSTPMCAVGSSMCPMRWSRSSISRWAPPAWTCAKLPADWKRRWKLWRRAVLP